MNEPENQELLRSSWSAHVRECALHKKMWFSVGFIFGYKLRQALGIRDRSPIERYHLHLRRVARMRDGGGDGLMERAAWQCGTYAMKELEKASRQLADFCQHRK